MSTATVSREHAVTWPTDGSTAFYRAIRTVTERRVTVPRRRTTTQLARTGIPRTPRDIMVNRYRKYAKSSTRPATIRKRMQADCTEYYYARREALGIETPDGFLDPLPKHTYTGAIHSLEAERRRAGQEGKEWSYHDYYRSKPGKPYNSMFL